tara:strand:- start:282 stop:596 length:315 start_codon:yes stop_codon:yes gene_type:complete
MFVESYFLYKAASKNLELLEKYKTKVEKYQDPSAEATGAIVGSLLIFMIVLAILTIGIYIWAIVDITKNCGDKKLLHIILLFILPGGYITIYGLLRLTNTICTK